MPYLEPSRPGPEDMVPLNGATSLEMIPVLTPSMPYSNTSPTRKKLAQVAGMEPRKAQSRQYTTAFSLPGAE